MLLIDAKLNTNLVVKKSKGNKEVLEDEFTQSLAFNGGIDSSLL